MTATVEELRELLGKQVGEPVFTEGMTRAESRAEMDCWLADCQAQGERLDRPHCGDLHDARTRLVLAERHG